MPNKIIFDGNDMPYGASARDTEIFIREEDTGKLILKARNKILLAGSSYSAKAHFNLASDTEITPTYNSILGLLNGDGTSSATFDNTAPDNGTLDRCFLFAVGTDGCGTEQSQVLTVPYAKIMKPRDLTSNVNLGYMVPFQFRASNNDLSSVERAKYFGRRVETLDSSSYYAYYFKEFESTPVIYRQYLDGTNIDSNVYNSSNTAEIQVYVEIRLKISETDFRDFFNATVGSNYAKWNSLSLLTGWKRNFPVSGGGDGYSYYQNIRPLTKFHISNESLFDADKKYDITYHIYY